MKNGDIKKAIKWFENSCEPPCSEKCVQCKYEKMALDALREKEARENPQPLTLDELREREGKPIFIVLLDRKDDNRFWAIRHEWTDTIHCGKPAVIFHCKWYLIEDYGKTWLAYDHKPNDKEVR